MLPAHRNIELQFGEVAICWQHQNTFKCRDLYCANLHICTAYLAGHCKYAGSECKHGHSCRVPENKTILEKLNLVKIGCDENLRDIFRHALPQICMDYQSRDGCRRGEQCHFLHICGRHAKGKCVNQACEMSHEYKTGPNRRILNRCGVDLRDQNCLQNALLADGRYTMNAARCSCPNEKMVSSHDSLASEGSVDGHDQQRGGRGQGRGGHERGRGGQDRGRGGHDRGRGGHDRGRGGHDRGRGGHDRGRGRGRGGNEGDPNRSNCQRNSERFDEGQPVPLMDLPYLERDRGSGYRRGQGGRRGSDDNNRGSRGGGYIGGNLITDTRYDPQMQGWNEHQGQGDHGPRGGRGRGRGGGRGGQHDRSNNPGHFDELRTEQQQGRVFGEKNRGGSTSLLNLNDMGNAGPHGGGGRGRGGRGRGGPRGRGQGQGGRNMGSAIDLTDRQGDGEDDGKKKERRQRKRGGRGRKNKNQNQVSDKASLVSSDSNNEAYSGGEEVDSDTDLYTSNIGMKNVKKDIYGTGDKLKHLQGLLQDAKDDILSPGEVDASSDFSELKEVVLSYLCQQGGWVKFAEMKKDNDLRHALSPFKVNLKDWLLDNSSSFILNQHEDGQLLDVAPIISVRICFKYNSETGCEDSKSCGYLHVCKDFIAGTCSKNCRHDPQRNHHLQDGGTRTVLTKNKLEKLKASVCCRVIMSTLPRICYDYNNGGCDQPLTCPWLHVCESHFLYENCKKKNGCLNHDIKFKQCRNILGRYHLRQESNALLRRMVLPGCPERALQDDGQQETKSSVKSGARPKIKADGGSSAGITGGERAQTTPNKANEDKPKKDSNKVTRGRKPSDQRNAGSTEPQLCEAFLRNSCKKCSTRHSRLPYLWQFEHDGEWADLPEEMNLGIEQEFCDVDSGRWNMNITMSNSEMWGLPFCGRTDVLFPKKPMEMQSWHYSGPGDLSEEQMVVPVRRLSTLSHINAEPFKTQATIWKWYYYFGDNWLCNEENSTQSYNVEQRYLKNDPTFTFREENMCLNYNDMILKHLDTGKTVAVRRRPVFMSKDDVAEKLRAANAKLTLPGLFQESNTRSSIYPDYWTDMEGEGTNVKLITVSRGKEFADIEQSFQRSMGRRAMIHNVRRIQNAELWAGYLEEKKMIETDLTKKLQEKYYFYICPPDMVDFVYQYGIVTSDITGSGSPVQNLGVGFYFAKDARLLHEVSKFCPDEYVIFLCKILIGSCKSGPIGDAYSKVVNDTFSTADGAVILKVENQQCYPEYSIGYKMVTEAASPLYENPPPYSPPVASDVPPPYQIQSTVPLSYPLPDHLAHIPQTGHSVPPPVPPRRPSAPNQPVLIPPQRFEAASAPVKQVSMSSDTSSMDMYQSGSSSMDMYQSGSYRPYPGIPLERAIDSVQRGSNQQRLYPDLQADQGHARKGQRSSKHGSNEQCNIQ